MDGGQLTQYINQTSPVLDVVFQGEFPGLKKSHLIRDTWTRHNTLPAKIMQVNN